MNATVKQGNSLVSLTFAFPRSLPIYCTRPHRGLRAGGPIVSIVATNSRTNIRRLIRVGGMVVRRLVLPCSSTILCALIVLKYLFIEKINRMKGGWHRRRRKWAEPVTRTASHDWNCEWAVMADETAGPGTLRMK
jgi:hypothetical protein